MAGKPPYAGVVIRRGEVNWIVHERGWSTDNFRTLEQAIDFRRVGVRDAIMSHVDLGFANLSGAVLDNSNFSGSSLPRANLSSTYIWDCNFGGAQLIGANLSGAVIVDSNFSGATLTFAHLSDASIAGNFKNADLTQARMDGATILLMFARRTKHGNQPA